MKKFILGMIAICLGICTFAFAGCSESDGKTEEEQFTEATESFGNYTVEVQMKYSRGGSADKYVLMIDGTKGKLTYEDEGGTADNNDEYFSEDYGKVFCYDEESEEWDEISSASGSTIEEETSLANGYVYIFQNLFYDDFEKTGDELSLKESALDSYSSEYGVDISSCRLKLENSRFVSATAVVEYAGMRIEVKYTFKNYGSTKVELPA